MGSSNEALYDAFDVTLRETDEAAARARVDPDRFMANLPGVGVLTFDDFWAELARQRRAFPDMGQNTVKLLVVEQGCHLAVRYVMTVHHTGPLTDWRGRGGIQATGKRLEIAAVDLVTFDERGLIIEYVVVSDRLSTTEQPLR